jgi:hypothetical protein
MWVLGSRHAGINELRVGTIDVLGTDVEVTEVDRVVLGPAEFELQPRGGVGDEGKVAEAMLEDEPNIGGQALDLWVQIGHAHREMVNST